MLLISEDYIIKHFDARFNALDSRIDNLERRIDKLEENQQLIRHDLDVFKAEINAKIEGQRDTLYIGFSVMGVLITFMSVTIPVILHFLSKPKESQPAQNTQSFFTIDAIKELFKLRDNAN